MGTTDREQARADRRAEARKREARAELLAQYPDMTDEQIEAQWRLVVVLGLDA